MFKNLICLILVSLLFYQCSTVQLVSTKKIMDIPVSTGNGIGNYREFPKDLNRSQYWYKDTNEEAVKVKTVDLVEITDLLSLTPGMTYEDVVKKVKKNPIDFVYTQKDGYRIVTFVYKRIFNLTDDKKELLPSNNGISKELGYDFKHAYLMFNKQNKLELMVSKDEMENGMLLLNFARDIYRVIKNDGDNLIRSDAPDAFFKTPKYNTDSTSTIEKVQPINSGKRK